MKPTLAAASPGYFRLFLSCELNAKRVKEADALINRMIAEQSRYEAITIRTGVPWYVVAIIHAMECSLNFSKHLANGDDLKRRTVNVPKGIPTNHLGPFTFEEGAVAALEYDRLDEVHDWTVARICYELEQFNGFGYRGRGINSAYLWSGSQHYTAGKYIADHVWSAKAVSEQLGAAVLLKRLCARRLVALPGVPV